MERVKNKRFYWKGTKVSEKIYNQRLAQQKSGFKSSKRLSDSENVNLNVTENNKSKRRKLQQRTSQSIEQQSISDNVDKETENEVKENEKTQSQQETPKPAEGRRIVELNLIGEQSWCKSCKECLSLSNIEEEQRRGLGSILSIRCHKCLLINIIITSKQHSTTTNPNRMSRFDVNTKLVIGLVDSGIGFTNLNKLLACLNIPKIDFKTYKRYEAEVGKTVENIAKESCEEATELERKLTLENLATLRDQLPESVSSCFNTFEKGSAPVTFDTVIQVIGSYDMGWSTRGNGKNYDSLNGFGSIVGLYSQAILDYSTCNRKCKKCDKGHSPFDHDCRLNFYGSAKAMESHTANKLVNESKILKSKNVEIGVFIGDNDSSAIAACRQGASHQISKLSDANHTSKGVSKELYAIEKNHQELKKDGIKYLHRCFTYAVAQNKGKSACMAETIKSIPYHAFNNHEKCGQWCGYIKDRENYDHRTIPGGFTDLKLFEELKNIFDKLANNAEKFSVGVSSNVNESLNASMASKAPKSKCLSLSASADYRYASVVCQKNVGDTYTTKISSKLSLSPAIHHKRYISRITKTRLKRAILIKTQEFKKNRILLKKRKSALRYQKETLEGVTYESNSTLLNESTVQEISYLSDDDEGTLNENCPVIYFDLETTGLQSNCDIVQIAAKCGNICFNVYINPKQEISASASAIHGLRKFDGDLMLHGEKVDSVSLRIAMGQLFSFLKTLNKKCYLAAHNLNFDGPRLYKAITSCSLADDFSSVIEGFIDTLPVIRECTNRTGKNTCTITSLADWLKISSANTHDASKDVAILEKIIKKIPVPYNNLVQHSWNYADITKKWVEDERVRIFLPTLNPLHKIVGVDIRKRLVRENITIEILQQMYSHSGESGITELLSKRLNKKATVTAHKPTIQKLIKWLTENFGKI